VLPAWLLPTAVITGVVSYVAWSAAATGDYAGQVVFTLAAASLFWLSIMVFVAFAVQRGVERRCGRR
jgi:hypothetical protein